MSDTPARTAKHAPRTANDTANAVKSTSTKGLKAGIAGVLALATLTACGASHTGWTALAMDGAGRLLAVVAICDPQRLSSLTLTDETTGTSATVRPKDSPGFGATLILTGPIANPQPEGVFDLLDRAHTYTLSGATKKPDSDKESGSLASIRFKLDDVAKEPKLRTDSVLTVNDDQTGTSLVTKANFVAQAKKECS